MTEQRVGRRRAIVVGATFGAVYAEALAAPHSPVELIGVLSRGSATSARLAQRLGVRLYTDVDEVPDVDLAFVVVRSGVVGGDGAQICERLLSRGIHVMQEQPVHADEILSLLRVAKTNSVLYAVNDFYSHIASMRQFICAAKALDAVAPIRYVHARSSIHVAFPLFTILGAVVGRLTPARIVGVHAELGQGSFASGRMSLGGVTVDLLIQNELCANDPDNHARLMHAITVGCDAGELVLSHTHGPTTWHRRPRSEAWADDAPLAECVGVDFQPTAVAVRDVLWPDAIRDAAAEFNDSIDRSRPIVSQRYIRATRLWSDFTSAIGPATSIEPGPPLSVSAAQLLTP